MQTNASLIGLGAELFQLDSNGNHNTISFASRTLLGIIEAVFLCNKLISI